MKNRHFEGECSWTLAGKARKCGRFWVFACVPNPGKQSIWRQCPPSARKQRTKKTAKSSRFYPMYSPSTQATRVPSIAARRAADISAWRTRVTAWSGLGQLPTGGATRPGVMSSQRQRDDNKNQICVIGGALGADRKIVQKRCFFFVGQRHDNTFLKVRIL